MGPAPCTCTPQAALAHSQMVLVCSLVCFSARPNSEDASWWQVLCHPLPGLPRTLDPWETGDIKERLVPSASPVSTSAPPDHPE